MSHIILHSTSTKLLTTLYTYACDTGIGIEGNWSHLIQLCEETCAMQVHNQCIVDALSGKMMVTWVQCSLCNKWLHCVCGGITKTSVVEKDFFCCKPFAIDSCSAGNYQYVSAQE